MRGFVATGPLRYRGKGGSRPRVGVKPAPVRTVRGYPAFARAEVENGAIRSEAKANGLVWPAALIATALLLAACDVPPPTPEEAALRCEERARAAQGPTGSVAVGANSEDGPYSAVSIGITADYLSGRDPLDVYNSCVIRLTGSAPYRPPVLR